MSNFEQTYVVVRGSDVNRDGMYLEIQDRKDGSVLLEIFYSDAGGTMTISAFKHGLPVELIEWAIEKARQRLPPASDGDKPDRVA